MSLTTNRAKRGDNRTNTDKIGRSNLTSQFSSIREISPTGRGDGNGMSGHGPCESIGNTLPRFYQFDYTLLVPAAPRYAASLLRNQERELREITGRVGCEITKVYKDHGISGARAVEFSRATNPQICRFSSPPESSCISISNCEGTEPYSSAVAYWSGRRGDRMRRR
jgi:hypothetical protein